MSRIPRFHVEVRQMDSPLLWLIVPFVMGIWAADAWHSLWRDKASVCFLLAVCSLILAGWSYRKSSRWPRFFPLVFLVFGVGNAGAALLLNSRSGEDVKWEERECTYRVRIERETKRGSGGQSAFVRLMDGPERGRLVNIYLADRPDVPEKGRGDASMEKPIPGAAPSSLCPGDSLAVAAVVPQGQSVHTAMVPADSATMHPDLSPGDILLCRVKFEPLRPTGNPGEPDYTVWLRRQGVSGTAYCAAGKWQKAAKQDAGTVSWSVRALRFRHRLLSEYARFFQGYDLAVISALTLGDRSRMDTDIREQFSQGGVSHVLALSGLHLSILFAIFQTLVLRPFRYRRKIYVALGLSVLCLMWIFVLIAGMPVSLVRAAIMYTWMQVCGFFRHDSFSVPNLAFAALLILIGSPLSLFDVGFQLSFLSVLAIILFAHRIPTPRIVAKCCLLNFLYRLLCVSFVAQIATAPLVAYTFHVLPVYGLLSNLVAVPAAYLILVLSLLFFLLPFARIWLIPLIGRTVRLLSAALSFVCDLPCSSLEVYPSLFLTLLLYLFLILAGALWLSPFRRKPLTYFLSALSVCVAGRVYEEANMVAPHPQIVFFFGGGKTTPVQFISSSRAACLWTGPALKSSSETYALRRANRYFHSLGGRTEVRLCRDSIDDGTLLIRQNIASWGGRRMARLSSPLYCRDSVRMFTPFAVDYLLLERGYVGPLSEALRYYRPRVVVLSSSLSPSLRRRYAEACRKHSLPFHDLAEQGAWVVEVE